MEQEALADLPGRLGLLMQHLVGDALARRVGRLGLVQETMLRILVSDVTEARAAESPEALWAHARTMARRVVVDAARSVRLEPRRMLGLRRFEGLSVGSGLWAGFRQRSLTVAPPGLSPILFWVILRGHFPGTRGPARSLRRLPGGLPRPLSAPPGRFPVLQTLSL